MAAFDIGPLCPVLDGFQGRVFTLSLSTQVKMTRAKTPPFTERRTRHPAKAGPPAWATARQCCETPPEHKYVIYAALPTPLAWGAFTLCNASMTERPLNAARGRTWF